VLEGEKEVRGKGFADPNVHDKPKLSPSGGAVQNSWGRGLATLKTVV